MGWYEEVDQALSLAIARLEVTQRRTERENRYSTFADDLRRVGLLPALQQENQSHQCADRVTV